MLQPPSLSWTLLTVCGVCASYHSHRLYVS